MEDNYTFSWVISKGQLKNGNFGLWNYETWIFCNWTKISNWMSISKKSMDKDKKMGF